MRRVSEPVDRADLSIVTARDRPDLHAQAAEAFRERWPEFIFHDPISKKYHPRTTDYFADFDILVLERSGGRDRVVAGGWGVPMPWDGTFADLPEGYDGALARSVQAHESGSRPTALSFMAVAVAASHDRQGLAAVVLTELSRRAAERGLTHVVAPLRPTWKHRYPTHPMADYATWLDDDGYSIDPWVRLHQRLGASILGPAHRSMVIEGSVAEWQGWTGMRFPATGEYVVPDALGPVMIDVEADRGVYVEENLWVEHHREAFRTPSPAPGA